MGVVDQPLPARRRTRLLEVDAHGDAEIVPELPRPRTEALCVVDGRLGVMHAAGTDDDEKPIISAVEDRGDLVAVPEDRVLTFTGQRQVLKDLRGRDQLDHPLDALVPNAVRLLSG